ncbi:response regulator [Pseudaeromonas sharmana]|uniref:Response regulator n=1 Tax=Pseudaeromonas sharmana TaxID=328412 RepID=A0ABV8CQ69_9GAMM
METVLIVDDEPLMLKAITRLLSRAPCTFDGCTYNIKLLTFSDAHEALEYLRLHAVSLVLSDYRMPGLSGVELLSAALELQPQAMRMIISGYADLDALMAAINQAQIYKFIPKPWSDYELVSSIAQALRHRELLLDNQRLADMCRLKMKQDSPQEQERRRLEALEPGITRVRWSDDGALLLDPSDDNK